MDLKKDKAGRNFIAIEYPGRVENIDQMVETLGGQEELSKGFQEKQKLQLKFRDNFYAKPVLSSEPIDTTGILLKIKMRKSKKHRDKKPEHVSTDILGTVSNCYKFVNFCDYQYLPLQKNEITGKTENIYNDMLPQDITAGPSWFREKQDVSIFLPPVAFTRSDTMQPTILRNETKDPTDEADKDVNFAITNRTKRATHGVSVTFSMSDPIPMTPNEAVKDLVSTTLTTQEEVDEIQKLFQQRPIWTLASLRAYMRIPPRRLNYILAATAFYYSTGPWRNCFVLFGFDPRKNFESRFYQMLDYRVRQAAGFKGDVNKRRSTGVNKRVKVAVKSEGGVRPENEIDEKHHQRRKEAIFTVDTIPPFRARHYQFTDIHVTKIQDMLQKIPSPISGALCNEKRGWLPVGFTESCRDILTEIAQANMLKHCNEKNISLEEFKAGEATSEARPTDEGGNSDSDVSESQFPEDVEDLYEEIDS